MTAAESRIAALEDECQRLRERCRRLELAVFGFAGTLAPQQYRDGKCQRCGGSYDRQTYRCKACASRHAKRRAAAVQQAYGEYRKQRQRLRSAA